MFCAQMHCSLILKNMVHLCMKHECFKQAVFHFSKLRFHPNFQEGNLQIGFPAVVATSIFLN